MRNTFSLSDMKKGILADTSFLGGQGWIRTTEVRDGRFTVCSLWPLGNLSVYCRRRMELAIGIEPTTC